MGNQFYPSSTYKNVRPSTVTDPNVNGSLVFNNLDSGTNPSYQELQDTVNEYSTGNAINNSAAKYPTDMKVGTQILSGSDQSSEYQDIIDAVTNARAVLNTFLSNTTQIDTNVLKNQFGAYIGQRVNKLQLDLEKLAYRVNQLNDDIDLLDDGLQNQAGTAFTVAGRYPSSKNRYSNTAGGL